MAQTVASYQQAAFSTPIAGGPMVASVVLGNDNTLRTTYNSHDADSGVHFQSSTAAARPTAAVAGRKWMTTDDKRIYYDNGSAWQEAAYLPLAGGAMAVTSLVANLNADLLDSQEGSYYLDAANLSGAVAIANGGLGITTTPSNGFVPIGNGSGYVAAAITAGTGIQVTNGSGSITIAVAGGAPNTGSGTANYITKYSGTNTQTVSSLTDDGTTVTTPLGVAARIFAPAAVTPSFASSVTVNLGLGSTFFVTGDAGVTSPITLAAPDGVAAVTGQIIRFVFRNTSGSSNLSVLWNSIYKGRVISTVGTGDYASESFIYNGTNWVSLSTVDGGLP